MATWAPARTRVGALVLRGAVSLRYRAGDFPQSKMPPERTYELGLWSIVFPVVMYEVGSHELGIALKVL